jgi:DNA-nicking Smr family endonuclease
MRKKDDEAALQESLQGSFSIELRLEGGDEPQFLRPGLPRSVLKDLRRGRWVVQDVLDLHGATRLEASDMLAAFLKENLVAGRRCLRVIHGKGLGSPGREPVLKHLVKAWLSRREEVLAFCQARPADGGEGALLVLLRAPSAR